MTRTLGFRLYMERDRDRECGAGPSIHVLIFPTKEEMYAFWRKCVEREIVGDVAEPLNFEGITSTWTRWTFGPDDPSEAGVLRPDMGQMLLHLEAVGAGVVSHECTHAAMGWARRVGLTLDEAPDGSYASSDEERLCWVQGWLVSQFWTEYFKRRPAEDPEPERSGSGIE